MKSTMHAFRRELARELPHWKADGVIDESAAQALVRRYDLDRLADTPRGWATVAFAILGAVAIGAGILSFVAANWAAIDAAARFAIVFGATIAAYGAAFALRGRGRHALAEAAFVAAALGFGGSIALSAQQFNFPLSTWQVYALWGAGLVPLALVLRSLPVATVALAAAAISLPMHAADVSDGARTGIMLTHLAVIAVLAAALNRRLGTPWFREAAIAVVATGLVIVTVTSVPFVSRRAAIGIVAALVIAVGLARSQALRTIGIVIAALVVAPSTFWWAYSTETAFRAGGGPFEAVAVLLLAAATGAAFLVHGRSAAGWLPAGIAVALAILLPHVGLAPLPGVVLANALILVPAVMLIARGVSLRDRAAFLFGTAVCAADGFFRFAEYDHNLTAKAAAFIVVGIAFIGAALVFERRQPVPEPAHAA
jgi:uncharacterized membrane protein